MTPTTPVALKAYRTRHTIRPVRDWDEDFKNFTPVCETDGIRVIPRTVRRNTRAVERVPLLSRGHWRHDPAEIKQLAALERGEGIRW